VNAANLLHVLEETPNYSTFVKQINTWPNIVQVLSDPLARVTVFAPTNDAFNKSGPLPSGDALSKLLWYHFVTKTYNLSDFYDRELLSTLLVLPSLNNSQMAKISIDKNSTYFINNYQIIQPNIMADNGVIHGIDHVLFPPTNLTDLILNKDDSGISYFKDFIKNRGLADLLNTNEMTLIIPTDDAFKSLPSPVFNYLKLNNSASNQDLSTIITYHFIQSVVYADKLPLSTKITKSSFLNSTEVSFEKPGDYPLSPIKVNDNSQILQSDILASNGAAHKVSQVLIPTNTNYFDFTLYKLLLGLGLTRFIDLLNQAGMSGFLNSTVGTKQTIFAPTNEAIDRGYIPINIVELQQFLQYHIVGGEDVYSNQFYNGKLMDSTLKLVSLNDSPQKLKILFEQKNSGDDYSKKIFVNNVTIITLDQAASNGIIHVINDVLYPPNDIVYQLLEMKEYQSDYSKFVNLMQKVNIIDILKTDHKSVFVPNNKAISDMLPGYIDYMIGQAERYNKENESIIGSDLYQFCAMHIVTTNKIIYLDELPLGLSTIATLSNDHNSLITINKTESFKNPNNSQIVYLENSYNFYDDRRRINVIPPVDGLASNGVIQKLDGVIYAENVKFTLDKLVKGLNLTMFISAMLASNNYDYLETNGDNPVTLFVPTNKAFENVKDMSSLFENTVQLNQIVKSHIVLGRTKNLKKGMKFRTVAENETILVNNDRADEIVLMSDVKQIAKVTVHSWGTNGEIYVIDRVLGVENGHGWWDLGGKRMSPGKIVAIALGVVLGMLAIMACIATSIYMLHHRRKSGAYVEI